MADSANSWGSDTLISMPMPIEPARPALIGLGDGWVMTAGGIVPDLDESTWEELVTPSFAPLLTTTTRFPSDG